MAQWLTNPTRNPGVAGSIPALAQWVKVSNFSVPSAIRGIEDSVMKFKNPCRPGNYILVREKIIKHSSGFINNQVR